MFNILQYVPQASIYFYGLFPASYASNLSFKSKRMKMSKEKTFMTWISDVIGKPQLSQNCFLFKLF